MPSLFVTPETLLFVCCSHNLKLGVGDSRIVAVILGDLRHHLGPDVNVVLEIRDTSNVNGISVCSTCDSLCRNMVTDMAQNADNGARMARFGPFEVDLQTQELRKSGRPIWLAGQSFVVLKLLLEKAPELLTREELQFALLPKETFVDFEHGLNAAVNKLRETLSDSAEEPKYIETLPRRGYRFIGEVERKKSEEIRGIEKKRGRSVALGIAAAAIVLMGVVAYLRPRPAKESVMLAPAPLTTLPGAEYAPALSPDGTRVAFAWDGGPQGQQKGLDLYVKVVGTEKVVRVTNHPSSWITSVWSPDGSQIAFHRISGQDKGIYVVSAMGGAERKLRATNIKGFQALISWSADGKWIGFADSVPDTEPTRVYLLNVETLEAVEIAHNPDCFTELTPTFSHRGEKLAYMCRKNTGDFALYLVKGLRGTPRKFADLRKYACGLAWTSDDQRIVMASEADTGGALFEIKVADGSIQELLHTEQAGYPTISGNNRLAYNYSAWFGNIWRKDLGRPEVPAVKLIESTQGGEGNQRYSPDGKRIAFDSWRGGPLEIWMSDADGENVVRIAKMGGIEVGQQWSPDGKKLAFQNDRGESTSVYIADVEERVARRLQTDVQNAGWPNWSRDGRWIYFRAFEKVGQKLYRCPAEGGKAEVVVNSTEAGNPQESFDGEELYYADGEVNTEIRKVSLKSGMRDEAVAGMPMVANPDLWVVTRGGIYFAPHKDLRRLRYYDFTTKNVREVFVPEKDFWAGFSLSPDGRFLLYNQPGEKIDDLMLVENFR